MFVGIAIGGQKAAGKDLMLDHLVGTRPHALVVRCKTPIVKAYEKIVGHPYDKGRDDAELIHISATVIRGNGGNDNIVADYLRIEVANVVENGYIPVVPDMRRKPENDVLYDECEMVSILIDADEDVRKARLVKRDGDLRNYKPDDDTERDVPHQRYHYVVDNNRDDNGDWAKQQLENYLARCGVRLTRRANPEFLLEGMRVQMCDPTSGRFLDFGKLYRHQVRDISTWAIEYDDGIKIAEDVNNLRFYPE